MVRVSQAAVAVALSFPAFASAFLTIRQESGGSIVDPSAIPSTCSTQCASLVNVVTTNAACFTTPDCLCSANIASALGPCFGCAYAANATALGGETPDSIIQQYNGACATFSVTASAASGTAAASGSASASGSGSANATNTASSGAASGTAKSPTGSSSGSSSGSPAQATGGAASSGWSMISVGAAVAAGAVALL